jgi:outer membrane receptor protein involved in Fe transport
MAAVALPTYAAAQVHQFDIAAGPLKEALGDYVRQSGRQVISRGDEVGNTRTRGVRGAMSADAALARLLRGTGFSARTDTSGAVAIVRDRRAAPVRPAVPDEGKRTEDLVVTGSRVARNTFNSPTPVNVVGEERMQALAIPNVGDALNQIPSFRATTTPASNFFRASANIGARAMDLRGLGTSRTLVLVDGRRVVPSSDNGSVDINSVPSALIKRAEIVTGGASAAYGADAVAGVVNLILDTRFTGFKMDINAGLADGEGDAQNYFVSFAGGSDFADGRGHFIAGIEWQNEQGIGNCRNRAHCRDYGNFLVNPGYNTTTGRSTNGLPATLVLTNVLYAENRTGVLASAVRTIGSTNTTLGQQVLNSGSNLLPAALRDKQFDATGGSLVPFQFGKYLSGVFMQGGDPSVDELFGLGDQPLVTQAQHISTLGHFDYDLTENVQAFGEVLFSNVIGGPTRAAVINPQALNLKITGGPDGQGNPFISPAVRAAILTADPNITSININVAKTESGSQSISTSRNDTLRAALGVRGKFGDRISWDASYTYGQTDGILKVRNTRLREIETTAADAVTPPVGYAGPIYTTPTGAPVICASSVTAPTNGCLPVNFLGLNSLTAAVLAKYERDGWQTRYLSQHVLSANLQASPFSTWAGPVDAAIGVEWRSDSASGARDPLSEAGVFAVANATVLAKVRREVAESYIETSIPLLADLPFARSLTIDGAKRWTHYSTSGAVSTWKAGLVYEPTDQILLRVTQSSDIRAPNAAELNPNTTSIRTPLPDPFGGGTHQMQTFTGGNPNLQVERSDTKTAGMVLKPGFIPGLLISTDYYNIKVADAIDTTTAPAILNACAQQNLLCNLLTFTGAYKASPVDTVLLNFQNLSRLHAEGVELVANYVFEGVGGKINATLNANYVIDLRTIGATGLVGRMDGVTGNFGNVQNLVGVPRYKLDSVVTYTRKNWSVTAQGRYIPDGVLDPTKIGPEDAGYDINLPNSISTNRIDGRFYLNLSGTYSPKTTMFGGKLQVYGSIANVLDTEEPDQLRHTGNPLQFDPVGRAYRVGFRSHW